MVRRHMVRPLPALLGCTKFRIASNVIASRPVEWSAIPPPDDQFVHDAKQFRLAVETCFQILSSPATEVASIILVRIQSATECTKLSQYARLIALSAQIAAYLWK